MSNFGFFETIRVSTILTVYRYPKKMKEKNENKNYNHIGCPPKKWAYQTFIILKFGCYDS
jgi:hypothetical protein